MKLKKLFCCIAGLTDKMTESQALTESQAMLKMKLKGKLLQRSQSEDQPDAALLSLQNIHRPQKPVSLPLAKTFSDIVGFPHPDLIQNRKRKLADAGIDSHTAFLQRTKSEPAMKINKIVIGDEVTIESVESVVKTFKSIEVHVPTVMAQDFVQPSHLISQLMQNAHVGYVKGGRVPSKYGDFLQSPATPIKPIKSPIKSKLKMSDKSPMDQSPRKGDKLFIEPPTPTRDKDKCLTVLGHSYPSLRLSTHTTFCCMQR